MDRKELADMEGKERKTAENIITPWKILANLKSFWWFCLIPLVLCGLLVYKDTMSTYAANQAAAQKDTYIASALIFYPTEVEADGLGNMVIFKSKNTIEKVNEIMVEKGYAPYDEGTDLLDVGHTMASYGLTLVGEGEERMLVMAQAFAESMLLVIEEATGISGHIVDDAMVAPCMIDASGTIRIYEEASERQVSLSIRDFLTWKRLMVLCAGVFLGLALIFVAILFDQKIRCREELEAFCELPCLGVTGAKKEKDKKLILSLIDAMCEDKQIKKLMLVSVSKEKMLADLARSMKTEAETYDVLTCEQAEKNAEAMNHCRMSDAVVLTVRKNVDSVVSVKRALANLEMIQADVLGYIMTE